MTIKKVIRPENLGKEFDIGVEETSKIHVKVDGITIVKDAEGKLKVDTTATDQIIVSADADQILVAGTDGGALLAKETFQDLVGAMVLNATDGLEYDDAIGALTAAVASTLGTSSDGVAVTSTLVDGVLSLGVTLTVDPSADNLLTNGVDGLMLSKTAINTATTHTHGLVSGDTFTTTVNGKDAVTNVVELQDAFGVHMGEILA